MIHQRCDAVSVQEGGCQGREPHEGPFICAACGADWPCDSAALQTRSEAMLRMLLDSGDITPMGVRMIKKVLDEYGGDA